MSKIICLANLQQYDENFEYLRSFANLLDSLKKAPIVILNKKPPELRLRFQNLRILPKKILEYLKIRRDKSLLALMSGAEIVFAFTYNDLALAVYFKKKLKAKFKIVYFTLDWKTSRARNKSFSKKTDLYIFQNEYDALRISRQIKLDPKKGYVLYPCFQIQSEELCEKPKFTDFTGEEKITVLIPGELALKNKPKDLINLFSVLPREILDRMQFIFSGPVKDYSREDLIEYSKFKKILSNCSFIDKETELNGLFRFCDIGLINNSKSFESVKYTQYFMQMKKPVITFVKNIITEYLDSPLITTILDPGDEDGFCDILDKLVNDIKLRKEIGEQSYQTFSEKFSYIKYTDKIKALLYQLEE